MPMVKNDPESPFVRLGFPEQTSLAELYHENTKYQAYLRTVDEDPTGAGVDYPDLASLQYVPPGREGRVALPDPSTLPETGVSIERAIAMRRSRRAFTGEPVSLGDLSKLLAFTYGFTGPTEPTGAMGRAAPSAGGRFPLEFFPVIHNVEGVSPGVYHYHPESHSLELVEARDVREEMVEALFAQPFVRDASFTMVVGAVFHRTLVKYKERGYRLILMDAGHAMENLYLMANAMGLGITSMGGFLDDVLNGLVRLNGEDENVVACACVGKLAQHR